MTRPVKVLLFARLREVFAADSIVVELPGDARVSDLKARIAERKPELAGLLRFPQAALDEEFVADDTPIPPDRDVALVPPVSGG
ncbi:MAG TPA: MoaD/ThiS family protein [Novosphingobium sp.]|nr:MoaD/ThiS family protein [Novosphingobium sp.]